MNTHRATCALRALNLCSDDRVVDYRGRPGATLECYCLLLGLALDADLHGIADALRTDRARTVARSSELQRIAERHRQLLAEHVERPPY